MKSGNLDIKEIERKWLVSKLPELNGFKKAIIVQGYIAITNEGKEVRLRKKDDKFFLTVKGEGNLIRSENEVELTQEQFYKLWPATKGKRLSKDRYFVPFAEFIIELDIYSEEYDGLVVAEVEFSSQKSASNFSTPDWFGAEITEDKRYKNKILAFEGLPDS